MTATARLHRELYARSHGIEVSQIDRVIDYDDSEYVVTAASTVLDQVLGWRPRTPAGRTARAGEVPLDVQQRHIRELGEQRGAAEQGTHSASQPADGTLVRP